MDQGQTPDCLARRKPRRREQPGGLDTANSRNRQNVPYLDAWIVALLLEFEEPIIRTDGQLGHVLKVLNDAEQDPETIIIGDGLHYIEVMVAGKAAEMTKQLLTQSGFSDVIGHFIILQNYTVHFKYAAKMEDCQFYLILECFQIMPMKREGKSLQNCNLAVSVLQKIKDLWQKHFVKQMWFTSEQELYSVSEILKEVNQDQLNTLKQSAKDCLNLLGPTKLLDSEQLAVYPDTKWQLERKQNKMNQDIFTVPATFLVVSAENEAALSESYMSNAPQAVPEEDEGIEEDDRSTVSFFSVDSASLDGSLKNPWDAIPGITLSSSSDASGPSHGPPQMQPTLLARPAEEARPKSNTYTSHFLQPCDDMPHSSSDPPPPPKLLSLFAFQNREFLIEMASEESDLITSTTSGQPCEPADSLPCGQNSELPFSPVCHSNEVDVSPQAASENREACLSFAPVSAKRKQVPSEEEEAFETCIPTTSSNLETVGHCSTETVAKSSNQDRKHVNRYLPLKFASTPKKRRLEEIQGEQSPVFAHCSYAEGFLQKSEEVPTGVIRRKSKQVGVQEKENAKEETFHFLPNLPTPELCSQILSVRISTALLEWACWVFNREAINIKLP